MHTKVPEALNVFFRATIIIDNGIVTLSALISIR